MMGSRDEKIPALKLAVVQYVIVAVLAVLITGPVATADPGRNELPRACGGEPYPQGADPGPARPAL